MGSATEGANRLFLIANRSEAPFSYATVVTQSAALEVSKSRG